MHQLLQSKQEIVFDFGSNTRSIVESYLSKINVKTAPGSINIEAKVFKECAPELSIVFTDLFNLCLECGQIPYEWKIAQITPVYKGKGNKSLLDNYRPKSFISPISKVFESVMGKKLEIILNKTSKRLSEGRSCHLALKRIINYCKKTWIRKSMS
jgi:hypothetical protein